MKQTLLFICCFIIASNIVETKKFFDPAIFQKCWRGVGEQPTFAEQITELHNETKQKSRREPQRIAIAFKIRRL